MAYGGFNALPTRAASEKVLHNKAFNIAKNPKYDGYKMNLASIAYNSFNKKCSCGAVTRDSQRS